MCKSNHYTFEIEKSRHESHSLRSRQTFAHAQAFRRRYRLTVAMMLAITQDTASSAASVSKRMGAQHSK